MLIGDANDKPTLKATADFTGFGLIDGNPYTSSDLNWVSTNVFYKQIRNLIIDTTGVAATTACTGIHWPVSQATSIQNVVFNMPTTSGVVHAGLFIESGSGGFMADLTFNGGAYGAQLGNQQYTMRNLEFNNAGTAAIQMLWDWDWTFMNLTVNTAPIAVDMSIGGSTDQAVGSVIIIDSTFTDVDVGVKTAFDSSSSDTTNGSLVLENVVLSNTPVAVQNDAGTVLAGGTTTISAFAQGHTYTLSTGPTDTFSTIDAVTRPSALLGSGNAYYTRSKPQYESLSSTDFVSVRTSGAVGDGATDDTAAIQSAITTATTAGKVVFIDHGLYLLTDTISIPAGAKIVGESYPVLMASGSAFTDINTPKVLLQVGTEGEAGSVELSDFIVSGQGATAGATLIEYNLVSPAGTPSGFWDVHTRVGGYTGSELQVAECVKNPGSATVDTSCIAAYMNLHATTGSSGLYMENCWLWTADHDIDDASNTQITVYSGRGLFIESTMGSFWLVGTAVEHHVLYQYQLADTVNIFASQLQTETPYFQPLPNSLVPFTANDTLQDPTFDCDGVSGNCDEAWGLRILSASDLFIYGANHYSWFDNYSQSKPTNCLFFLHLQVKSICMLRFCLQIAPLLPRANLARRASSVCRAPIPTSTSIRSILSDHQACSTMRARRWRIGRITRAYTSRISFHSGLGDLLCRRERTAKAVRFFHDATSPCCAFTFAYIAFWHIILLVHMYILVLLPIGFACTELLWTLAESANILLTPSYHISVSEEVG